MVLLCVVHYTGTLYLNIHKVQQAACPHKPYQYCQQVGLHQERGKEHMAKGGLLVRLQKAASGALLRPGTAWNTSVFCNSA